MVLSKEEKERRLHERRVKKWNETHKLINGIDHKICNICINWFPSTIEYFYDNKANGIDGLYPYCKTCVVEKSRQSQLNNHEEYKEYLRVYLIENKEAQRDRRWSWRARNREHVTEYRLNYQRSNKDKIKIYNEKRQHKTHDITDEEWDLCRKYFNNECAYCGISEQEAKEVYGQYLHKDHAFHDGSNEIDNCIPACKMCNSVKWQYPVDEWYAEGNSVFDEDRLNKIIKWLSEDVFKVHINT